MKAMGVLIGFMLLGSLSETVVGQEMEPRIYATLPAGLNFVAVGYARSTGSVVIDVAVPIEDFRMTMNQGILGYARAVNLFGRSGMVQVLAPYVHGRAEAVVAGQDTSRTLTGFADPRIRMSINLLGGPSLTLGEFARYRQRTIVGVSLQMTVPLGAYDTSRQLNLGSNRWGFKPEMGVSQPFKRWTFEVYGGVWLFTENNAFRGVSTVKQDPLWTLQGHVIYAFRRRGLWAAFNSTFFSGGKTKVDGVVQNSFQANFRFGATLAVPLAQRHALKAVFSTGVATRFGQDFDSLGLFYQYRWGGGL